MANLVTLSRLLLLLLVVWIFYQPLSPWSFANFFLIIFIFVSDGLDGYIARKRNETSLFGALFDIAGDRIIELTLWIVAADIDLVPIWVPLVFIIRGVIVDTIRSSNAVAEGVAPFALMRSPFGKFIVAGKFVRVLYAVAKASRVRRARAAEAVPRAAARDLEPNGLVLRRARPTSSSICPWCSASPAGCRSSRSLSMRKRAIS